MKYNPEIIYFFIFGWCLEFWGLSRFFEPPNGSLVDVSGAKPYAKSGADFRAQKNGHRSGARREYRYAAHLRFEDQMY